MTNAVKVIEGHYLELLGGKVELAVLLPKEIVQVTMRQLWNGEFFGNI